MEMLEKIKTEIAAKLDIPYADLYENGVSFATILAKSSKVNNSLDILEVVAGTIAENHLDEMLDLPVFTLESEIDSVIDAIHEQLSNSEEAL